MTAAEFEISELDKSLAEDGEDIILRRVVGSTNQVFVDVKCRAFVRGYEAKDLIAGLIQRQRKVIISPTQINRAQWPGGQPISTVQFESDPRIPNKNRGDKCIIAGGTCAVETGAGIQIGETLIRIDMRVLG